MIPDVTYRDTPPEACDPSLARARSQPPQEGVRHPARALPRTDNPCSPPVFGSPLPNPYTMAADEIRVSVSDQVSLVIEGVIHLLQHDQNVYSILNRFSVVVMGILTAIE